MTKYILPYKAGSKSAKALSEALNAPRIRTRNSRFRGSPSKTVINWGNSHITNPEVLRCRILNAPAKVALASNKLSFFQQLADREGVLTPDWTTVKSVAEEWSRDYKVICRTILNGHSGAGITIACAPCEIVDAPLYTKYINKDYEWRVHVVGMHSVSIQRKARRMSVPDEDVNWQVRNHDNGFVYIRGDLQNFSPTFINRLQETAENVVNFLGLDFGAVDLISNCQDNIYVLEVNTAPGLEGATVSAYADTLEDNQDAE